MSRYFIYFSYDGAAYHGWQVQPNAITVQQVLEDALSKFVRMPVSLVGAGRTDSGVNAACMVAHADLPCEIDTKQLCYKLNRILPPDIAVSDVRRVKDDAHARFDAISRRYMYRVVTEKSPFLRKYACRVSGTVDFELMNRAACILYEYTDFTSFSKLHTDVKTNNCKVTHAEWKQVGDEFKSDGASDELQTITFPACTTDALKLVILDGVGGFGSIAELYPLMKK